MVIGVTRKLFIILFFLYFVLFSGFGEDKGNVTAAANSETLKKPALVILPLISKDIPAYIPKVVDKLLEAKLEKIDTYTILPKDDVDNFLQKQGIVLKTEPQLDYLKKYSDLLDVDQIMYGIIRSENKEYKLVTRIYDVKKQEIILKDTETAANIRQLDTAAEDLTRKIIKHLFPPAVVKKAEKELNKAANTKKEAQVKKNLADFAALAEKNPEKALSLVDKPARKALENSVKEKVKKEVVHEEIQNLFEKEKAEKRRVWQFWTMIGLESSVHFGNLFGAAAVDLRLESLLHWSNYMNSIFIDDPYRSYRDVLDRSQGNQIVNYLFTGGANLGLALAYKAMPNDLFSFSGAGRQIFAISNMLQISGYMASAATAQFGFYAQRKYLQYSTAISNFTEKYEAYRSAYIWPMIAEYSRTGLWTLGLAGMVTAALLPGEKTPMILTDKSRKYLTWGQTLISIGNFTSGMAMNLRAQAEESWITDNSSSGTIGDSSYMCNYITSEVLFYSTYAIYLGGAVMTYLGLTDNSGSKGDEAAVNSGDSDTDNLSFSIVPAQNGITAVARLRLD